MDKTLLGVMIGGGISIVTAALGIFGTLIRDRVQWRRESSIRFNMQRAEVYPVLFSAASGTDEFRRAMIAIPLIASEPVRRAADRIQVVWDEYTGEKVEGTEFVGRIEEARQGFADAVRRERGIE